MKYDYLNGSAERRRKSEYWNFYRNGISPSGLECFMGCREQFRLRYVEAWDSGRYNFSIEFGHCLHYLRWLWTNGEFTTLGHELRRYHKEWMEADIRPPKVKAEQELGYAIVRSLWGSYTSRYASDHRLKWIFSEEFLRAMIKFDDGTMAALCGIVDGVYEDDDGVWLYDLKTKGEVDVTTTQQLLPLDLQVMCYLYILARMGLKPRGVVYDIVRRTKARPLKRSNESILEFAKRMRKDVKARPAHYFNRIKMPIRARQIKQFAKCVILPWMNEVKRWTDGDGVHFLNPHLLRGRTFAPDCYDMIVHGTESGFERLNPLERYDY